MRSAVQSIIVGCDKKLALKVLVILATVWAAIAHAAVGDEGGQLAAEPTVAVGWVVFFLLLFVAVCVWIGVAIWRADKKKPD